MAAWNGAFRLCSRAGFPFVGATAAAMLGVSSSRERSSSSKQIGTTRCEEYCEHNANDFDYYVKNPTAEDLPTLLHKFDVEGQEVWPWIWTHPNADGPHHVFLGVNGHVIERIQELRKESPQNNILIIVPNEESLHAAAKASNVSTNVYAECQCGIVTNAKLQLLNSSAKILMLDDERVIAFDYLLIS